MDTGSPVTILPPDKEIVKDKGVLPLTRKYQDVHEKECSEFIGKRTVDAKKRRIRKIYIMLSTEQEDIKPLLGMDWLREFSWTI